MGCSVNEDVIIKPFVENKLPFPAPSLKDHSALKGGRMQNRQIQVGYLVQT